ncbi:MAG: two-component system sensor histidine kinase NtrB [Terriglobales bacterium]
MAGTSQPGAGRGVQWTWMDLIWLLFLAGLAVLPPIREIHKQLILLGFAVFQIFEGRLLARAPRRGPAIAVAVKIALATLLIAHTETLAINSRYYPIYWLPVMTAAMLFGTWGTLGWTTVSSVAYCAYLWPALQHYQFTTSARDELALRIFFFYFVAIIINRFVIETRRQRDLYRQTAESLAQAQAEARTAERLAALGQLSAGLAHEIRNPLQVIKGSAEMLQQQLRGGAPVAVELAGYISEEVNRTNLLVSRFLDFAKPLRLERQTVPLAPLLDRALADAGRDGRAAGITIERHYAGPLPPLSLDAPLCERAFANLAQNALEAMATPAQLAVGESATAVAAASPSGTLYISAMPAEEQGQAGVAIEFRDTGPGVPDALREQIFNPFFTTKPTGVGLGLAIVAKIIDQHGGRLRLGHNAPGAVFTVFLPAAV